MSLYQLNIDVRIHDYITLYMYNIHYNDTIWQLLAKKVTVCQY